MVEAGAPAAIMAIRARLAGIDVRHRQALPFEGVRLIRLDVGLAYQIQLFAPHGNDVHLGGSARVGLTPRPRLEGMPPKSSGHEGQQDFRRRIGLET